MTHDEAYRIAFLVAGYIRGTLTETEKDVQMLMELE